MASKAALRLATKGATALNRAAPSLPLRAAFPRNFPSSNSPSAVRWHGGPSVPADAPTVNVVFVDPSAFAGGDGGVADRVTVPARVGETLLQTAHRHKIPIEGACEGVCACSTCHVILPDDLYDWLIDAGEEPSEDEEDMLDMAPGLTATSRLGCQVTVTESMEGVEIHLPAMTRNFYVDGHVPEPH